MSAVQNVYAMPPPPTPKAVPPPPPSYDERMWTRAAAIVSSYQKNCRAKANQRRRQQWLTRTQWAVTAAYELIAERHGDPPISLQQWEDFCWTHQQTGSDAPLEGESSSLDEEFEIELNITFNLIQQSYRLFNVNHLGVRRAFRKLYESSLEQP